MIKTTLSDWDKTLLVTSLRAASEVFAKDASVIRREHDPKFFDATYDESDLSRLDVGVARTVAQLKRQAEQAVKLAEMIENVDAVDLTTDAES